MSRVEDNCFSEEEEEEEDEDEDEDVMQRENKDEGMVDDRDCMSDAITTFSDEEEEVNFDRIYTQVRNYFRELFQWLDILV